MPYAVDPIESIDMEPVGASGIHLRSMDNGPQYFVICREYFRIHSSAFESTSGE